MMFQEIYETYRTRIVRYLTRLVREAEAEDLTQEVFVKVSQSIEGFRGESQLLTWIYRIATNTALNRFHSPSLVTIQPVQEVEAGSPLAGQRSLTVEQQAIRNEMSGCVRQVIDRLPETYLTAIVLGDIEGFKDGEVA
jgi:RNA polymerase sigma-70 factor (ECF subfamily)